MAFVAKRLCSLPTGATKRARAVSAAGMKPIHGVSAALLPFFVADVGSALATVEESVALSDAINAVPFLQDFPVASSAAGLLAVVGVAFAVLSGKPKSLATGAQEAFEALKAEERTILVDLRTKASLKEEGVLDLREANKKPMSLVFAEPDDEGNLVVDPEFATKLQELAGITQESIVILIDSDGSLASKAAADAAQAGFFKEKVYWVRDGVEGPKGWKAAGLPTKPYRVFELSLPSLELPSVDLAALAAELQAQMPGVDIEATVDRVSGAVTTLTDKYKENPTLANGVLAVAGVAAVGVFAVTELEAILQVVGALGLARFLATNLLFAKDREATLAAVRGFMKDRGLDGLPGAVSSAAAALGAAGAKDSSDGTLQRLANIVMGASDASSAAKQITEEMVPEMKGVDTTALAAALAAAGFEFEPSTPPAEPLPATSTLGSEQEDTPIRPAGEVVDAFEVAVNQVDVAVATPANVLEARSWIAAWKESRAAAPSARAAATEEPVVATTAATAESTLKSTTVAAEVEIQHPANVIEAREWIAAWKSAQRQVQPAVVVGGDGAFESDPVQPVAAEQVVQATVLSQAVNVPA